VSGLQRRGAHTLGAHTLDSNSPAAPTVGSHAPDANTSGPGTITEPRHARHLESPRAPRHGGARAMRIVGAIGKLLICLGVVLLLFTAYLLWGTSLFEASHQHALRQQFEHELSKARAGGSPSPYSGVRSAVPGDVPAEGQPVGILQIPKIGLDKVVVEGTGTNDLREGPGHYSGTPLPGQPGNSAIAGHRTTYGAPFYDLNELSPGDQIVVTTLQGKFLYRVTQQLVVSPSDTSVVASESLPELTLTTCNPRFSATQRLVVHAQLVGPPAPVPNSSATTASHAEGLAGAQGSWVGAAAWGLGFLALVLVLWLFARRSRRRWPTYTVGLPALLVILFFFFQNVSPLLPASF
jgi:sortase A